MTEYTDLQKAAEYAAQDTIKFADEDEEMRALQQFHEEVDPETILALIADLDEARNGMKHSCAIRLKKRIELLETQRDQLIADNERLTKAVGLQVIRRFVGDDDQKKMDELVSAGIQVDKDRIAQLETERDQLKAENELARMRIKEMDLLFGRYILAMRSALIEEEHGKGPAAAMQWIYNSLAGPGELPPEGETDSQAYFDREIIAVDDGMQEVMAFHDGRRAALGQGEQS